MAVPDRLVALTFDDGPKSQYTFAAPLLKECGFNATFYITEGLRFLVDKERYMTWEEVAAIMPPGGASFHHNLTYHGSGSNVSTRMRRSFAIHLRTENSAPAEGVGNEGLTEALDEPPYCPVVYRKAG